MHGPGVNRTAAATCLPLMSEENRKLASAWWTSANSGVIALARDWKPARLPPLFLNPGERRLKTIQRAKPLHFGEMSGYYILGDWITFVFVPEDYPGTDYTADRVYVAGSFNGWDSAVGQTLWELSPTVLEGRKVWLLTTRFRLSAKDRSPQFKFVTGSYHWIEVPADATNAVQSESGSRNFEIRREVTGRHLFLFSVGERHGLSEVDEILWKDGEAEESVQVRPGPFFRHLGTDLELGALCEGEQTTFRLFAPRARTVRVVFAANAGMEQPTILEMERADETTFEATFAKNLHGYFYHYHVDGNPAAAGSHFDPAFPVLDPYAKAVVGPRGPGIVWDRAHTPAPGKKFKPPRPQDVIMAECHVRDLIAKAPVEMSEAERRGFAGLAKVLRKGGDYLERLGVNTVELQPVQENDATGAEEYHWGYMTANFFSPDSGYATRPLEGSQIAEFADLVKAFHERGTAVVLDVVYNHVGEPAHLLFVDKAYYFELNRDDQLTNWSGVGNDLRCGSPMARRLIVDSLKYLVETFDVDGFRFDLAELIGMDVLREIERELRKIKPGILLIAEPWSFRGHIAWALKGTSYSFWNDGYREFLRDYVLGKGNQDGLRYFLAGSTASAAHFPAQSVNYVESHDDYAFLDRITEKDNHNAEHPTARDQRRIHLLATLLFGSMGMPMMSAGQDFLRTKFGHHNTYQRGDINALDFAREKRFKRTAAYWRAWIAFRLSARGRALRLAEAPPPGYLEFFGAESTSALVCLFNANGTTSARRLLLAVNPHDDPVDIALPDVDTEAFHLVADTDRFARTHLRKSHVSLHEGRAYLAGLSCALWVEKK